MTSLVDVLGIVKGQIICVLAGQPKVFASNDDLLNGGMYANYIVYIHRFGKQCRCF